VEIAEYLEFRKHSDRAAAAAIRVVSWGLPRIASINLPRLDAAGRTSVRLDYGTLHCE